MSLIKNCKTKFGIPFFRYAEKQGYAFWKQEITVRTPFEGEGNPEPLRFRLPGSGHALTRGIGLCTLGTKRQAP